MRILVIEDDGVVANVIELMLHSEGCAVSTARCGAEGIDAGKQSDFDVIMLDLNLSDMSGFDVLRELRRSNVRTPVVILSGNAIMDAKVKALGYGANDYVTKPFRKDELIARLRAVARPANGVRATIVTTGKFTPNLDSKTGRSNRYAAQSLKQGASDPGTAPSEKGHRGHQSVWRHGRTSEQGR